MNRQITGTTQEKREKTTTVLFATRNGLVGQFFDAKKAFANSITESDNAHREWIIAKHQQSMCSELHNAKLPIPAEHVNIFVRELATQAKDTYIFKLRYANACDSSVKEIAASITAEVANLFEGELPHNERLLNTSYYHPSSGKTFCDKTIYAISHNLIYPAQGSEIENALKSVQDVPTVSVPAIEGFINAVWKLIEDHCKPAKTPVVGSAEAVTV